MSAKDASAPAHVESTPGIEKRPDVGGDDGLAFVLENGQDKWTKEEEKRVVRKIDLIVLPMVCIVTVETCSARPPLNQFFDLGG